MPEQSVEELYVQIGSDISKLLKETEEGVKKATQELDKLAKSGEKSFGKTEQDADKATKSVDRLGKVLRGALKIFKLAAAAATAFLVVLKLFPGIAGKFNDRFKVMLAGAVKFSRTILPLINNMNRFFKVLGAGAGIAKGGAIFGALTAGAVALAAVVATKLVTAFGGFFVKIGKLSVEANKKFEVFTSQFETLLGSSSLAKKRLDELAKFGVETPFELNEIVEASRILEVFGGEILATGDNLRMIGDVAAGVNQPFKDVATWVGRIYDAMQSGRPFGEASARLQEMGALSGKARAELEKMQKEGASGAEMWERFNELVGAKFAGNMERLSGTLAGITSNLIDFRDNLIRIGGQDLFEEVKDDAQEFLDIISDEQFSAALTGIASALGEFAGAVVQVGAIPFLETLKDIDTEELNDLAVSITNAANALDELGKSTDGLDISRAIDVFTIAIDTFTIVTNAINKANDATGGLVNTLTGLPSRVIGIVFPIVTIKNAVLDLDDAIGNFTGDGGAISALADFFGFAADASETAAQKTEKAREAEAARLQGLADMAQMAEDAANSNDELNDSLEDTKEISEAAAKALDQYGSQLLDLQEDNAQASIELEEGHTQALTDIQDDYTDSLADAEDKRTKAIADAEADRTKAVADAEKTRIKAIADLEKEVSKARKEAVDNARKELADLEEDTNRTLKKERGTFNKDELRETEDHLDSMRQLRQQYLDSIDDAVKNRDARALADARKNFQKQESEQESAFSKDQGRRKEDQSLRLAEIRDEEKRRADEIMMAQEEELASIAESEKEKRETISESYQEQLVAADENYQEAATKAEENYQKESDKAQERRDEQLEKEQESYEKEKEQLDEQIAERLETIAKGLADQDDITDEEAEKILNTLAEYFGVDGEIDKLMEDFANRRRAKIEIQVGFEGQETTPSPSVVPQDFPTHFGGSFATGGTLIANKPTLAQFGEVPEMVQFTPLSQLNSGGNQPRRMEIDLNMSGSAPPGIRSADRDQIGAVLVNALMEAGFDTSQGERRGS